MQYQGESNNQDIISSITFHTDATTTDYSVNDRTRNVNKWYHKAAIIIQTADGTWQWDDTNNTTLPIGTADLVSGQQDYTLSDAMLEVEMIEFKDANGNWIVGKPIDISSFAHYGQTLSGYQTTNGTPSEYDKRGRSLFLYPAPNYNSTGGLKVHFKRSAAIFAVTDTTKEPGFEVTFHEYLALGAALDYCLLYKQERVPMLREQIQIMESDMKRFYARRTKDLPRRITPRYINCR